VAKVMIRLPIHDIDVEGVNSIVENGFTLWLEVGEVGWEDRSTNHLSEFFHWGYGGVWFIYDLVSLLDFIFFIK
jgi:hypothetical protein